MKFGRLLAVVMPEDTVVKHSRFSICCSQHPVKTHRYSMANLTASGASTTRCPCFWPTAVDLLMCSDPLTRASHSVIVIIEFITDFNARIYLLVRFRHVIDCKLAICTFSAASPGLTWHSESEATDSSSFFSKIHLIYSQHFCDFMVANIRTRRETCGERL